MEDYYKQFPSKDKFRHMNKLTMFVRKSGGPKLRGKAIEVRSFGPIALALWQRFANPNVCMHNNLLVLLKLMQQVDVILEENKHEFAFSDQVAKKFSDCIFNIGHLQLLLESHYQSEEGVPHLFTSTSKLHGLAHSALLCKYVSPRIVWCFTGEDYMKHIQHLSQSCLAGTGPYLLVNKMADKMRVALHVQFSNNASH